MKEWMNISELSEYLSIKAKTLYALAGKREIPHYRVNRLLRFRKSEIDQWMEEKRKEVVDTGMVACDILNKADNIGPAIDGIIRRAIQESKKEKRKSKLGQGLKKGENHERTS